MAEGVDEKHLCKEGHWYITPPVNKQLLEIIEVHLLVNNKLLSTSDVLPVDSLIA